MNRHRWFGVVLGSLLVSPAHAQTPLETDEQTLRSHNMPTDGKGLLNFFQQRSMKDGDAKHLEALVRKLGSDVYREREPAAKELILRGPVSLPFLRSALTNSTLEMKRRAEMCMRDIEATMQSEPISAAARVLALRNQPKAAEVLFNFVPSVSNDAFLEEEILACVGRLTVQADKVDPLILKALRDAQPFRRNAAAYVLGRRGGVDHRASLRELLADADPLVRQRAAEGLFGKRPAQVMHEAVPQDETLLRGQKIEMTEAVLLKYFRDRTLSDMDQARFRTLVKNMGSGAYPVREQASKQLVKEGPSVLAFLKEVEFDANVELARRAQWCIDNIRGNTNPAVPIAAAHLLTRPTVKKDASAPLIRTLLAYIPFVDDESVEEEILTCLTLLSLREPNIEPELLKALDDPSPMRRAAAAYVLGHVGAKDHVAKIKPLLDDANAVVRLRAAQGLLAARDKSALPRVVNLLLNVPPVYLPRVEDTLFRLSEDKGPNETISADSRQKAFKAWDKWLETNQAKIDLAAINDRDSFLGLITICEYDNRLNNINGQVWETNRGNAERWKFSGIMGAMDAHALPNGRVLVAENNANLVTERDVKGVVKWEFRTPNNPICCQRLPNGNTFIASYNMVMEVTPNKTEVYRYTPGPQFYIFSAHKAKNGHIVAITAQGQIIEMDSKTGKQLHTVQTNTLGNWCSVELMPNGNYLVASMSTNSVREIDRKNGQEVWSKPFAGAFRATRLPNGNVLVASMTTREVAELDRSGAKRWSTVCTGRPWSVHYR